MYFLFSFFFFFSFRFFPFGYKNTSYTWHIKFRVYKTFFLANYFSRKRSETKTRATTKFMLRFKCQVGMCCQRGSKMHHHSTTDNNNNVAGKNFHLKNVWFFSPNCHTETNWHRNEQTTEPTTAFIVLAALSNRNRSRRKKWKTSWNSLFKVEL